MMIGQAIYISNFDKNFNKDVDFYFTSFHIAEEFNDEYKSKAHELLKCLKETKKKIIVDISPRGIQQLGYSSLFDFIEKTNIDGIRFDFGYSEEEILQVSQKCLIAINASTTTKQSLEKLKDIPHLIAIHNFYPRPETGLDVEYFKKQNQMFKEKNIEVYAFISGDEELRGPLYEGLVTLEKHRYLSPYLQYLDMKDCIDHVIIADPKLSKKQFNFIQTLIKENIICVEATLNKEYHHLYNQVFTNRIDSPNTLIRMIESRQYATQGDMIEPSNCIKRTKGSITIDNKKYLRYSGEIQITKIDYPENEKINVIGFIHNIDCLQYIDRNQKFKLIEAK